MMMSITSSCHHTRSAWWMCAADTVTVVSSSKVVLVLRDFGWLKHVSWIYSAAADLTSSVDLEAEFQLWTVRGLGARILVRRLASSSPHSSCSASSAMSPTSPSSNIAGCRHCRLVTGHRHKGEGWTMFLLAFNNIETIFIDSGKSVAMHSEIWQVTLNIAHCRYWNLFSRANKRGYSFKHNSKLHWSYENSLSSSHALIPCTSLLTQPRQCSAITNKDHTFTV